MRTTRTKSLKKLINPRSNQRKLINQRSLLKEARKLKIKLLKLITRAILKMIVTVTSPRKRLKLKSLPKPRRRKI
jgi:hypothetical protein